jgi:AAA domain
MSATGFTRSQKRPWPEENGGDEPPRFAPVWLDDIKIDSEPAYIVEGIIPAGPSLGETAAPPKSLKSFFLKDLGLHIAAGKPYRGRDVLQGAVIYITSEGVRGVKRRLVAMRRHHGVEGKKIPFALIPTMPNLGTGTADLEVLIAAITTATKDFVNVPVRMIVIDTLRRATPGKNENDAKDMSVFLDNCNTLAVTFRCHVNFAHHSPRSDNNRGSGTNAVDGACDVILSVSRCDDGKTPRATVTIVEMKDGEDGDAWTFELRTMQVGIVKKKPLQGGYVLLSEGAAVKVKKKPTLSDKQKLVHTALAEALAEVGTEPPSAEQIPPSVKNVVTNKQWRQFAHRRDISKGTKKAKDKAFERAAERLITLKMVGVWDDNVWIPPKG